MNAELSNNSLFDGLARGERGAVDDLCRRYEGWVAKTVDRRMGMVLRSRLEAMDLAQDVMIHVIRDAPRCRFSSEGHFRAWLRVVVERKILGEARRWSSPSSAIWNTTGDGFQETTDPSAVAPDHLLEHLEIVDCLWQALALLKARDRAVVTARIILGLPWQAVAAVIGSTVASAQMRLVRSRRRLARVLRGKGIVDP